MTNPTSNFGWQMPTATDLVTDLPADFEVFGQAVDTDFVDLLGGTTGQILSKASATDLDFTWITNDVGDITAVTVTAPITGGGTSGSVGIAISAATTSASGAVQLSDSTSTTSSVLASTPTATKSAYDLAASAYAPAFTNNFYAGKNKIINGNFAINQRNFTSYTTVGDVYNYDRFVSTTNGDGTVTWSPQVNASGDVPGTPYQMRNFLRCVTTGQTTTNARAAFGQRIEGIENFAGQTATISFWAKAATGTPKIAVEFLQRGDAATNTYAGQVTINTSWTRYYVSVAVPSLSGVTLTQTGFVVPFFNFSAASDYNSRTGSLGIQTNTFDVWGIQIEAGSTATPFQTASGSVGGELALCQRYYYRTTASALFGAFSGGNNYSTTTNYSILNFPVTMRTAPASIETTGTAANYSLAGGGVATTCSVVPAIDQTGTDRITILATVASGLTAGFAATLRAQNTTSAYIGVSAEL